MLEEEQSPFVREAGEYSLSGSGLQTLLRAILDKGKPFRFQATGQSMIPFIRGGDVITISPFSGQSPRVGQVVAFLAPCSGKLAVHRIIGRRGQDWLIKGDNCSKSDGMIPPNNLLGRVIQIERDGKSISLGLGPGAFAVPWLLNNPRIFSALRSIRRTVRRVVKRLSA